MPGTSLAIGNPVKFAPCSPSARCEKIARRVAVPANLPDQRFDRVEMRFVTQLLAEFDADALAVQVGGEIEEEGFQTGFAVRLDRRIGSQTCDTPRHSLEPASLYVMAFYRKHAAK